jgi:hypothetical protein
MTSFSVTGKTGLESTKIPENSIGATKEKCLTEDLAKIAEEFSNIEKLKHEIVQIIRKEASLINFSDYIKYFGIRIKEAGLVNSVIPTNIRGLKVAAVDGSLVTKKFQGIDLIFLKAVVVKYFFKEQYSAEISYYPDLSGYNNYSIQSNYLNINEEGIDLTASLEQKFMEINQLNKMLNEDNSLYDIIVLDGSILVTPINLIFSKNYKINQRYNRVLKEYRSLYETCENRGITLVGSIKDTRTAALANSFIEIIPMLINNKNLLKELLNINYREIMAYFSDFDLFSRLLKEGERTCAFRCNIEIDKVRDTSKKIPQYFPESFYIFYLKSVRFDNPLRIEFYIGNNHSLKEISKKADLIASIIYPLSNLNNKYALPIPQIEAHKRSVFQQQEINFIFNSLKVLLLRKGISLFDKRRNRRPF